MKLYIIALLLFSTSLSSQILPFEGSLIDGDTNEPIAYAHLQFVAANIGTSTSTTGDFKMVIEKKLLNTEVLITCLGYQETRVEASKLLNKSFTLQPTTEVLQEVIVQKEDSKEISIGSLKAKKALRHLHKQDTTMIAQFITGKNIDPSSNYLKTIKIKIDDKVILKSKVRLRIFDRDPLTGAPGNDLLSQNVVINIDNKQKKYEIDVFDFLVEVPQDGFFIAIEKFMIPENRCFIAEQKRSTYKKYVSIFNNQKNSKDSEISEMLSFEKYKEEKTLYAPVIYLSKKSKKEVNFGDAYSLNSNKWEIYQPGHMVPLEIVLSN